MLNIIIFGPPGAGKGTQSESLMNKFNLTHLSTGDVFRKNIREETKLGMLAKSYIDKGELVPDEVTIGMVQNFISDHKDDEGIIFDGFPRTIAQGNALDEIMKELGITIDVVLALEVDEDELIKRLLNRGLTSGRQDDQDEATIKNRLNVYQSETEPLLSLYASQGKLVRIPGMGSIDEIFDRLVRAVSKRQKQ